MGELFNLDFSTGDLSQFDGGVVVADGNSLQYHATAGHRDGHGMRAILSNSSVTYGLRNHDALIPNTHQYFGIGLYLNQDAFNLPSHTQQRSIVRFFTGTSNRGNIRIVNWNGTREIAVTGINDGGGDIFPPGTAVGSAKWVYLLITRSSSPSSSDARIQVWLDDAVSPAIDFSGFILYNNFNWNRVRVGATGPSGSGTGTLDFGPLQARNDNIRIEEPPATVPDPPSGTATALSQFEISLSITSPIHDGGEPITQYKIEHRTPPNSGNYALLDTVAFDGPETSYLHEMLSPGSSHQYRFIAANSVGDSAPSSPVIATTFAPVPDPIIIKIRNNAEDIFQLLGIKNNYIFWDTQSEAYQNGQVVLFPKQSAESVVPSSFHYTFLENQFTPYLAHYFTGLILPVSLNYPHTSLDVFVQDISTGQVWINRITFPMNNFNNVVGVPQFFNVPFAVLPGNVVQVGMRNILSNNGMALAILDTAIFTAE